MDLNLLIEAISAGLATQIGKKLGVRGYLNQRELSNSLIPNFRESSDNRGYLFNQKKSSPIRSSLANLKGLGNFGIHFNRGGRIQRKVSMGSANDFRSKPYQNLSSEYDQRDNALQSDSYGFQNANKRSDVQRPTKIVISNLDFNVNDEDIKELYFQFGQVKRYGVHYTQDGKSLGTAEVHYEDRDSAFSAYKKYNNVTLDGRPMRISILEQKLPVHLRLSRPFYRWSPRNQYSGFPQRRYDRFQRNRLGWYPRNQIAHRLARKFVKRSQDTFYYGNQRRFYGYRQNDYRGQMNSWPPRRRNFRNYDSGMNLSFDEDL